MKRTKKILVNLSLMLCLSMLLSFGSVFAADVQARATPCGNCDGKGQIQSYTDKNYGSNYITQCVHYLYGHDERQNVTITTGQRCNYCGYTLSSSLSNSSEFIGCHGYNNQ